MPFSHPLEAITLDLDDTLWPVLPTLLKAEQTLGTWLAERAPATHTQYTPAHRQAIRQRLVAEHPGRAHDMSWLRREGLREALRAAGEPPALADDAFAVFLRARQEVTLYPDVRPVLERWKGRYRLVALTNGNADIAAIGLGDLFDACVSAHDVGCAKPDPRMFQAACRAAGSRPERTLHVGDDWHLDVRAARTAGLQAAWIKRPDLKHPEAADASVEVAAIAFPCLDSLDRRLHDGH